MSVSRKKIPFNIEHRNIEFFFAVFSEAKTMTFHFERHHNIIPNNILCTECGRGFAFQHQLQVHFAEHHDKGGSAAVMCDQCGKKFNHRKRLVSHIRSAHNKTQEFPCHLCDKKFHMAYKLQKHLQIHTGIKPFRCNHCAYRSNRSDNVLLHCRKVHHLSDAHKARDVTRDESVDTNGKWVS